MSLQRACPLFIVVWGWLSMLAAGPAWGCYSGLAVIPTADVVGAGQYSIELQTDGLLPVPRADVYILNTEAGIGDRFEVGVDFDLSEDADPRVLLNAKYVLAQNADCTRALALGVSGVGEGVKSVPYLVGTADLQALRLHLGGMRLEDKTRWFIGADRDLTEKINLGVDYTEGDENYSSVALGYQLTECTGIFAGVLFPNDGGDTEFTLHLIFGCSYRGVE